MVAARRQHAPFLDSDPGTPLTLSALIIYLYFPWDGGAGTLRRALAEVNGHLRRSWVRYVNSSA